jgi:hypothetical protein
MLMIGEIPLEETLAPLNMPELNEEQARFSADRVENLVGVLGNICSGLDEVKH